jgi:purine-binding chemotaxis protein CheW
MTRPPSPSRDEGGGRAAADAHNLVRFRVGDTCYAFDVLSIEEVTNAGALTELPNMGHGVAGVTDHRGRVIPIVDLRPRFGLERAEANRQTRWILMRSGYGLVGFVVDRVLDVVAASGVLTSVPQVGGDEMRRGIRGVVNVDGVLVFVLDEDRLASVVADLELPEPSSTTFE